MPRLRPAHYRALAYMGGGIVVTAIPIGVWWKSVLDERHQIAEQVRTKIRLPNVQDTDDYLIEKCQPGDVVLFDRRCEKCAAGPFAFLACTAAKTFLCDPESLRTVEEGKFDHIGLIVPGYIRNRTDEFDPNNLLLLEATSGGIVARPLKARLEHSTSRTVLLVQLNCPGEKRNLGEYDDDNVVQTPAVQRTRAFVKTELTKFRDKWLDLGKQKNYAWMHTNLSLAGALAKAVNISSRINGPVSPSAYIVLLGLQQASAAQNINDVDNRAVKVEDFLRDYRFSETDAVRLRPGWKFLAPIVLRENQRS